MGTYSPMFGLVGTLIGLIQMLKGLTDPRAIGQGMSVALMATFYGVLLAGLIFLPLAGKVRTLDLDERLQRDQIIAALLAIRLGQNPEYIRETLEVFTGTGTARMIRPSATGRRGRTTRTRCTTRRGSTATPTS